MATHSETLMRVFIVGLILSLAACGSSTEPGGLAGDPALLVTNNLDHDWVYVTWQDGNAIFGKDSVPPQTASQCIRFLAQPDSAQWIVTASQTGGGFAPRTSSVGGVFFDPESRPAWRIIVSSGGPIDSPAIIATEVENMC